MVENLGLVGLSRGVISKKLRCLHVAIAAVFGLISPALGALYLCGLACHHPALVGFAVKKLTLAVLRPVGSQEKDFLFLAFA